MSSVKFNITTLFVPDRYLVTKHVNDYELDAKIVIKSVFQQQRSIYDLLNIMFSNDVEQVSIDFITNNGIVQFIDWDTERDLFR